MFEIKKYPDKILRRKCKPVEKITPKEAKLFKDMLGLMLNSSGIGLAAPQLGINLRMIVADIGASPVFLANPQVVKAQGNAKMEEGCLSVPQVTVVINRPDKITVQGLDENNQLIEIQAHGLLARVILHEIDHLNGKLILDYMSFLQRLRSKLRCSKKS
ncbi:MAG: peptide deformylase [Candidatus Omnitrophica bacterium]|nr:peptide deformylase [Candidatus Omnitrophota bacterium]